MFAAIFCSQSSAVISVSPARINHKDLSIRASGARFFLGGRDITSVLLIQQGSHVKSSLLLSPWKDSYFGKYLQPYSLLSAINLKLEDKRFRVEFKASKSDESSYAQVQSPSLQDHFEGKISPNVMFSSPKDDFDEKFFDPRSLPLSVKLKRETQQGADEFKMHESDCGSSQFQIAQLTTKIKHLSSVLHKKDKSSQRGLQAMVQRRRKLLKYLRRTNWDSYCSVISNLGLKDKSVSKN